MIPLCWFSGKTILPEVKYIMLVCTPFITLRNGRRLLASEVGKEAFCFEVTEEEHKKYLDKKNKTAPKVTEK
jgi:hypothetical protein